MSNLPPGVIPKVFRMRNKDGKEIGSYYTNVKKKPINLRTQDYMKARKRAVEAHDGKRDFPEDKFTPELPQMNADIPTASQTVPPPGITPNISDDWTADATHAAASGQTAEPEYFAPGVTPPFEPPPDIPKATPTPSSDATHLPPELMEGLVKQIASTIVELQIHGQEYLFIRWGKLQPGEVPIDSEARKIPAAIWESQVRKWIPLDVPLPEWVVAPILVAMMAGTIQLEGAKPIRKPETAP